MNPYNPYGPPAYPQPGYPGGQPGYPGAAPPQPSYGGHPVDTGSFCSPVSFVPSASSPYPHPKTVKLGNQTDGCGELWSAVAITPQGTIPGKAKDGTCWYPYGGKENLTKDFYWLTCCRPVQMRRNSGSVPPQAIQCGFQTDGAGYMYAAIAETKWGRIPGKAKDNACWYAYGGKEHHTNDFHWLVMA